MKVDACVHCTHTPEWHDKAFAAGGHETEWGYCSCSTYERAAAVDDTPSDRYREPRRADDNPAYRAAMRDAGRGELLR